MVSLRPRLLASLCFFHRCCTERNLRWMYTCIYIYKNRNRAEHFFDNRYLSYRTRLPFHIQHQILNTSYTPRREIRSILLRYVTAGRCVTQPISAKRGNAPMAENRGRHADSSSAEQAAVPSWRWQRQAGTVQWLTLQHPTPNKISYAAINTIKVLYSSF